MRDGIFVASYVIEYGNAPVFRSIKELGVVPKFLGTPELRDSFSFGTPDVRKYELGAL